MYKNIVYCALFGLFMTSFTGDSVVGTMFPEISGETLSDTKKTLPADGLGKFTLITMAYSSDSENDLSTWVSPIYNKFIAKTGMMDSEYDVNLFFIPMYSGENIVTANIIRRKMKEEISKEIHSNVIFYKGELKKYKAALGMDNKDLPYLFLLDKTGKIVYATSGQYSEAKMDAIDEKIE